MKDNHNQKTQPITMPPVLLKSEFGEVEGDENDVIDVLILQLQSLSTSGVEPESGLSFSKDGGATFVPVTGDSSSTPLASLGLRAGDHVRLCAPVRAPEVSSMAWMEACTVAFFASDPATQPRFNLLGKSVCYGCATTCRAGAEGLAEATPGAPFVCGCSEAGGNGCILAGRLEYLAPGTAQRTAMTKKLQDAAVTQVKRLAQLRATSTSTTTTSSSSGSASASSFSAGEREMISRFQGHLSTAMSYESLEAQQRALAVIPVRALLDKVPGGCAESGRSERDELSFQLLRWFRRDFFKWVDAAPCESCGGPTRGVGNHPAGRPTEDDLAHGASRVEVYLCNAGCPAPTRFPRYNNPVKLLETRRGRCGEWANCFTLCCRALGLDARLAMDWTDHVWTEVWSEAKGRWVHLDSCDTSYDAPLMYEAGWGKKLTYIVSFSAEEVVDVTRRYTRSYVSQVLPRRTAVSEQWMAAQTAQLSETLQARLPAGRREVVRARAASERRELELTLASPAAELKPAEMAPRESGSAAWREARGECGSGPAAGHTFEVGPDRLAKTGRHYRCRYFTARDVYIRNNDLAAPDLSGWALGARAFVNVKRFEEYDWKMCYLARVTDQPGYVVWHWDFSPCGDAGEIVESSLLACHTLHADSTLDWLISTNGIDWHPHKPEPAKEEAQPITDLVRGAKSIYLKAEIPAKAFHNAAQLFRMELAQTEKALLDLKVTLKGKAT
jgi:peptide-N4-(N-acetyl-beta-glucosaminyl)asparagine amidase